MLFSAWSWPGIADGSITVTFRRWKRPQAIPGRRYRTPVGFIEVRAVDLVDPAGITDQDARRSGYESSEALMADLRGEPATPVTRIEFRFVGGPDLRDALAGGAVLTEEDRFELDRRLAAMDRRSASGPWTAATLAAIRDRPAVRAGDLAASLGRERLDFKRDVRKLKELGLTLSLQKGYRLSPRGEAYLSRFSA